jgi:transcriptional regulator with XRE-family HTH domain
MRPSPLRHPLAILRRNNALTQKQLADLAERSRPTIQAIELGKLQLSEKLAQRIAYQTGVAPGWLLDDDVAQPPTRGDGTPFTQETFELAQASLTRPAIR